MIGARPCRCGCSLAYLQPEKDRFNFLMERLKRARDEKSHIHFRSKRKAWISVRRNDSGPAALEGIRQALALATVRGGRYRRAACLRSGAGSRRNERGVWRALSEALDLQEAAVEGGLLFFGTISPTTTSRHAPCASRHGAAGSGRSECQNERRLFGHPSRKADGNRSFRLPPRLEQGPVMRPSQPSHKCRRRPLRQSLEA
jgi:hypothetical protein